MNDAGVWRGLLGGGAVVEVGVGGGDVVLQVFEV